MTWSARRAGRQPTPHPPPCESRGEQARREQRGEDEHDQQRSPRPRRTRSTGTGASGSGRDADWVACFAAGFEAWRGGDLGFGRCPGRGCRAAVPPSEFEAVASGSDQPGLIPGYCRPCVTSSGVPRILMRLQQYGSGSGRAGEQRQENERDASPRRVQSSCGATVRSSRA